MIRTVLLAAAALAIATPTFAATAAPAKGQAVAIKGRDLSTPEGAKTFYRDLARASADVCGGAPTNGVLALFEQFDECYRRTLHDAVVRTNAPLVTAQAAVNPAPVRVAGR